MKDQLEPALQQVERSAPRRRRMKMPEVYIRVRVPREIDSSEIGESAKGLDTKIR